MDEYTKIIGYHYQFGDRHRGKNGFEFWDGTAFVPQEEFEQLLKRRENDKRRKDSNI